MSDDYVAFCTKCGGRFTGNELFCTSCGEPRARQPRSAPDASTGGASVASRAHGAVAQVAGVAGSVAGVAQLTGGLPWQTIVAGETPDLRAMFSRIAMPGARTLVQRSLKKPGLSMAVTTVLDLFVAGVSGGTSALASALPRAIGGGLTALLSLVTGSKGGALRGLTGIVSLVTALVQVISLGVTLIGGITGGTPLLSLLPMVVAMASALVMALKTASVALRRRS